MGRQLLLFCFNGLYIVRLACNTVSLLNQSLFFRIYDILSYVYAVVGINVKFLCLNTCFRNSLSEVTAWQHFGACLASKK